MKSFLQKIAAVALSLLMLVSTTSFAIDMHFCGNHLVDINVLGDAAQCDMEKAMQEWSGCSEQVTSFCCSDDTIVVEGQDEISLGYDTFTLEDVVLAIAVTHSYHYVFLPVSTKQEVKKAYPPPLITSNFQQLYEQYLI